MATRTASVTGNWTNTATWGGDPAPVAGDFAILNGNVVLTVAVGEDVTCEQVRTSQTNNSGGGISTLVINGKLTADQVRIGDISANQDGKLICGLGGWLVCASNLILNACQMRSTATQASPFKITGGCDIDTLATGPKQDIQITNVSFRNTGIMKFYLQNTVGANASNFTISNCMFVGNSTFTIGSTDTINTTPISITNCDFRDLVGGQTITIRRVTGGVAAYTFSYNTCYQTSGALNIQLQTSTGMTLQGNVFYNAFIISNATGGGFTCTDNFFPNAIDTPGVWATDDGGIGNTMTYNYLLTSGSPGNNLRGLIPSGSGGSGTNTVAYNLMEGPSDATHDPPDLIVARGDSIPLDVHHNIIVGGGEIMAGGRITTWNLGITIKNNTITGPGPNVPLDNNGIGHLFGLEGELNTGAIRLANNLVYGLAKLGDVSIDGTNTGAPQVFAYSDYGDFYNIAVPYQQGGHISVTAGNTGLTVPGAHDIVVNPFFLDNTRNAARWNLVFGSGINTNAAVVAYFATLNGYRGTPNFDQGGVVPTTTVRQMVDWVRLGYSPTNLLLRGAGDPLDGSPDIGAMPVYTYLTKVGGSGVTKVGGSGVTKVNTLN